MNVAFLRAINVGGRGIIRMSDLGEVFTGAGCTKVSTYIQSGNVIFEAPKKSHAAILKSIQTGLRKHLDGVPGIMIRSVAELEAMVAMAPFRKFEAAEDVKRYVTFLSARPHRVPALPFTAVKEGVEVLAMHGLDLFAVSRPLKNGSNGFPNAVLEKACGVPATTRNWTTITKILDIAGR